ncbi:MAG: hypothetical protein VYA34_16015 [Myxococcota bacterium]|nr:hypothetical protein [Myxococcota bacterium]
MVWESVGDIGYAAIFPGFSLHCVFLGLWYFGCDMGFCGISMKCSTEVPSMRHVELLVCAVLCLGVGCSEKFQSQGEGKGVSQVEAGENIGQGGVVGSESKDDAKLDGVGAIKPTGSSGGAQGSTPVGGFGVISGACGVLTEDLRSQDEPVLIQNAIDFSEDPYDEADYDLLTEGGQEIIDDGNAGGSSLYSEVFAYEILARCDGAALLKTETEINYQDPQGKITDLLVEIHGERVGVSVTRAVVFPRDAPYTVGHARELLENKLGGILESTENVAEKDNWKKQILHIIVYGAEHAESLQSAFLGMDSELKSNTIVYLTVSDGEDGFLY